MRFLSLFSAALLFAGFSGGERERGRQVYMETTSPSGGEIVAVLGEGTEIPGSAVPCSGCHGRDGRGRPEGGVAPTDVTWKNLTRPYGLVRATGQRVPPYDEASLAKSIAEAVDPAGVSFHVAMPRYKMSREDMDDLIAFLKGLGEVPDPGVGESEVRIALLPPPPGPLTGMGDAVRAAVAARFTEVNREGGVFGRRLELVPMETEAFAAVAPFAVEPFGKAEMPAIGPLTQHPREDVAVNRYLFYLFPGIAEQAGALARHAGPVPHPVLLAPEDEKLEPAIEAVKRAWSGHAVVRYRRGAFDPAALARGLAARGADPLLFLGSGPEAVALLRAAGGWRPRLLVTALAADGSLFEAPQAFDGRILLALPAPTGGATAEGEARYRALALAHGLPAEHRSAQLAGLAAAEVLLEGLKRCGRDLTRDGLIEKLEGLRQLATGYAPPLTFGPSRRLGARGAYLMRVDLAGGKLVPEGGWVEAE